MSSGYVKKWNHPEYGWVTEEELYRRVHQDVIAKNGDTAALKKALSAATQDFRVYAKRVDPATNRPWHKRFRLTGPLR